MTARHAAPRQPHDGRPWWLHPDLYAALILAATILATVVTVVVVASW